MVAEPRGWFHESQIYVIVTSVTVPLFIVIADSCNSHTLRPLGRLKSGTVTNVTFVTSVNYH